jgi:hypothetical protein
MKQFVAAAVCVFAMGSTQAAVIYSEDFESYSVPSGDLEPIRK